jgi:T5SS/PEP-CTERM-associated repeat protein
MCYIGLAPTSQGYVVVDGDGSTWTTGHLHVGYMGASDLTISNGGKVFSSGADIGHLESWQHSIAVDGIGSMWMNRGGLSLGTYAQPGQKVTLSITDGGQVAVAGPFSVSSAGVDYQINMSTGGMLTLNGHADASLASFLALIEGPAPIRYWDNALMDWADITGATYGEDYTLTYLTEGDLAGYTVLTVPEPATMSLLALGGVAMLRKRR